MCLPRVPSSIIVCVLQYINDPNSPHYFMAECCCRGSREIQEMRIRILSTGNKHGENDACNRQFIQYENICSICYRTPFQKANYSPFATCPKCNLARWCSEECKVEFDKAHTADDCSTLRLLGAIERVQIDYAVARQGPRKLMIGTVDPRRPRSYIPLSQIRGWEDYYKRIFPRFQFAYEFTSREFKSSHPDATEAVRLMAMEHSAVPLTVIAGLEAAGLATRDSLTIHFLGAAFREASTTGMMEELLHYLPTLKKLHICYVGPEVDESLNEVGKNFACEKCRRDGALPAPADLVVGLNTGMTGIAPESWKQTLEYILLNRIPGIFTAYTKPEAEMEDKQLRKMGAKFLVDVQENKWRGVIPTLNAMLVDPGRSVGLAYNSNYWYVVQGH
ncbi:hypothetical protein CVT26_008255 [Gymnopilus dilepis]|uniref:Mitochondrial splicing suppressor 51-like C-terminal domain-containing protein n=1 Tax=Gymnopilus dilepis TaxID=231916 RepID=A0A409XXC0_9AGAR|nr:hypothetical protein CVT26_008255 [Gymnopilus dilepis]